MNDGNKQHPGSGIKRQNQGSSKPGPEKQKDAVRDTVKEDQKEELFGRDKMQKANDGSRPVDKADHSPEKNPNEF